MDIDATLVITLARSEKDKFRVKKLVEGLRRFGGFLGECPVCCFETDPTLDTQHLLADLQVQVLPLTVPDTLSGYPYADKVHACAHVESMVGASVKTILWIDAGVLIIQPPLLYDLDPPYNAAFRPVHIQNIGLSIDDALNAYWEKIYQIAGIRDVSYSLETFIEKKAIRAYFNTHAFAINPAHGLLQRWQTCFERLVNDTAFQTGCCSDQPHRIFLHQAVLSAVVSKHLPLDDIRILPTEYNYPYNLQSDIPEELRASAFNDLVSIVTENRRLNPDEITDIEIHEPLKSWLFNE